MSTNASESDVESDVENTPDVLGAETNASVPDMRSAIQEKVTEYSILVAPVEQAIQEMQLARGMLRARAEDEINALSPPLAALSEVLGISTLDLLTAKDRVAFLREAVLQSKMPVEEIRRRVLEASAGTQETLHLLELSEG
jgi:hypothetical protein